MSYIQFQQTCLDCKAEWNAAFGMVGTMLIAEPPVKCPTCGSTNISKLADGWKHQNSIAGRLQQTQVVDKFIAEAVEKIIQDISGRSGLGNQWERIDDEVQAEIKKTWYNIIKNSVENKLAGRPTKLNQWVADKCNCNDQLDPLYCPIHNIGQEAI